MRTIPATTARGQLFKLLQRLSRTHQQFRITSKTGSAVVMSEEEYESLMETLEILSAPKARTKYKQAKADIKEGRTFTMDEVF